MKKKTIEERKRDVRIYRVRRIIKYDRVKSKIYKLDLSTLIEISQPP